MKAAYRTGGPPGCGGPGSCPTVYQTSRRTYLVQGWVVGPATAATMGVGSGEGVVEVWPELLGNAAGSSNVSPTSRGTLLVKGTVISAADAGVTVPDGEMLVEVPVSRMAGMPEAMRVRDGAPEHALA